MTVVLDWSAARPRGPAVAAVAQGAARYLGDGRFASSFNLTVGERDDLHGAGVPIALVWEREATRMDGGAGTGERDARVANDQADALGWPSDRPIYMACDDRNGGSPANVAYVAAAQAASRRPVGVYGPALLAHRVSTPYRWVVRTWPGMPIDAQLVQEPNIPPPIPGTDVNTATGDWGGWLPSGAPPPPVQSSPSGPTGQDFLDCLYLFHHEPYGTSVGRTSPTSGFKDCSGLGVAGWTVLRQRFPQLPQIGGTVSTSMETWAVNNGGHYISREEALVTPGCFFTIWGYGSRGHIGYGTGGDPRGAVFETPSAEGHRVGWSPAAHDRWERWMTLPGIDHLGHGQHQDEEDPDMLIIYTTKPDGSPVQYLAGVQGTKTPIRFSSGQDLMTFVAESGPAIRYLNLSPPEFETYFGLTPS